MLSCIFGRCSSETYVVNKTSRTGLGTNGVIISHVDPDQTIVEVEERNNNQQVNTREQVRTPQGTQNGHVTQVPEGPSHLEASTPEYTASEQEAVQSSKYNGESTIDEQKGQSGKYGDKSITSDKESAVKSTIGEKKEQSSKYEEKSTISEKKGLSSKPDDKSTISEESSKYEDKSTTSEHESPSSKYNGESTIGEEKAKSGKYEEQTTTSKKRGQSTKPDATPAVKESETQPKSKVKAPQPPRQAPGVSQASESGPSVTNGERRSIHQIEEVNEATIHENEQEEDSTKVTKRRSGIVPLPVKYDETAQIKFKSSPKTEK